MNTIEAVIVLAIIVGVISVAAVAIMRGRTKPFKEEDFVEVQRPDDDPMREILNKHSDDIMSLKPGEWMTGDSVGNVEIHRPGLDDMPLAQVFRISDDPTDRFEAWAAETTRKAPERENYYMSITEEYGKSWTHPFLPDMHPLQWVRIVAKDYEEARKVATHYSGGYYAVIQNQRQFNDVKGVYFTRGEYEVLDAATYFDFQKNEAL